VDDFQRVSAVARHGNTRHDFAFTVEFGQATPFVGRQFDACDVADQHWRALVAFEDQRFEVALAAQVALAAHHVLGFCHLDDASADIAVRVADHLRHLHQRDAVGTQLDRVDRDLIGLHEAADRSHFGDAMGLGQLIADVPVLDGAQFGQRLVFGEQRILVNPADAGGVRSKRRRDALRHAAGGEIQIFKDARARPVDVGAILENDVHEGGAEERKAAHHL
jgi:hypothetical protein